MERASQDNLVGNIYKGRVVNLEPSIQAAFVDFGVGRNGFLHISDVEPQYFRQGGYDPAELETNGPSRNGGNGRGDDGGDRSRSRRRGHRPGGRPRIKPPIQDVFRRGDEVLVQVIKEGIGAKGPTLSTYISIPGRYLVLMPALGRLGVSRKIEDEADRRRLRETLLELNPPKGLGFIVRTAGQDRSRKELSRDMAYLLRLWKVIVRRIKKNTAPVDIYEESDMIIRTIRDIFSSDVDAILVDEEDAYERAKEFLQLVMPRYVNRLQLYTGKEPLFHKYKLEAEIGRIHKREVPLRGGGSIVIDQTEALVAIDVNSGNFRADDSAEETAYQLNLAAAREIARQLRLRDLGGVIVNDFIDMRKEKHRRGLERAMRDGLKRDRARTKILRTSPFGLVEMTRQRIRPSLKRSVYADCPCCNGRGVVKTAESMSIEVIRMLMLAGQQPKVSRVTVRVNDEVASYLNNRKRREITNLEEEGGMTVQILGSEGLYPEHLELDCRDQEGREIRLATQPGS
jgi:ribonuclease E